MHVDNEFSNMDVFGTFVRGLLPAIKVLSCFESYLSHELDIKNFLYSLIGKRF